MIDLRFVKKLVEMVDASSVDTIEISNEKGMKIRVSKRSQQRATVQLAAPMQLPQAMAGAAAATGGQPEAEPAPKPDPAKHYLEVKSPMVGTFYGSPEPGAKPYVSIGDRISKGQILCIIEAMKIMNEIESEFDGVVKQVLAQNAHPVEYGQVLFRVDPNG
jgi:acetyl-CoA carboxylase biotin carboxyl carrier protein